MNDPIDNPVPLARASGWWARQAMLALACLVLGSRCAVADDRITVRDGKEVAGRIEKESPTEVVIRTQTGPQTIEVNRITHISYETFEGQSSAMVLAKTFEAAGNWPRAAEQFAKAQKELADKPFILQAARFGEGRALAKLAIERGSGADEAIARLESARKAHPQSRHEFASDELLGRLYLEKKDYAKAAAAFDELAKAPWADTQLRAGVCQARVLKAEKKLDPAIARLDAVVAASADSAELQGIQAEALLEKAACLRAQNRRDQEIETLEQAIARTPATAGPLQAEGYVALGDALRAAGKRKDALVAYLHVDLLFGQDKEFHARALYNLTQLWSELGQSDRADKTRSTLKSEYPDSSWTKKLD